MAQMKRNGRHRQPSAAPAQLPSGGSYASARQTGVASNERVRGSADGGTGLRTFTVRGVPSDHVERSARGFRAPPHEARRSAPAARPDEALASASDSSEITLTSEERARFHALYCEHFDFVFRNLRRLGVAPASTDDALQDVYLVVLRRLADLQDDTHVKAWLFAILLRVAGNHRRSVRRRAMPESLSEARIESSQPGPFELTARAQAGRILHVFLSGLDDAPRAVFVMAELEQMTAPEIARVLSANVNTVYSWLRNARLQFADAIQRLRDAGGEARG